MARGPAPTPTNIHALKGSWRASARLNSGEPPGTLLDRNDPPDDLNELLRPYWLELVPAARDLEVMTLSDVPAMKLLCELMWKRDIAMQDIAKNGMVCSGAEGGMYQSPSVGIHNQTCIQIHAVLQQFGLTPASRTRVRVEKKAAKTEALPRRRIVS